ncbi:MAG: hypothetical protein Q7O66_20620, partial [Dehalococcoidia bacterium]|nr:hypothetical protein [Dehalococcoidia bacterium]
MKSIPKWLARHRGGELAPEGTYWSLASLEVIRITGAIDFLPGKDNGVFIRVPTLVVPIAGLFLGLIYVIALSLAPLIFVGWLCVHGAIATFR